MDQVEKHSPKRVVTDVAPNSVDRAGDRLLLPGDCLDMLNGQYLDMGGKRYKLKNTKGTLQKPFTLPDGENTCIGSFRSQKHNTIIYMVQNSNHEDRVIEYSLAADTFTVLLQGDLGFSKDFYCSQGDVIDDLLIWNDRNKRPRKINLIRARVGGYDPENPYSISFAAKPPLDPPTALLIEDTVAQISLISDDTFQFAHRYIYNDNERTTFSPLSKVVWPGLDVNRITTTFRAIQITVPFPEALVGLVKKIEFIYRRGNNGAYTVFGSIVDPTAGTKEIIFRNNENHTVVPTAEETRVYDNIPDRTEALGIIDGRVFMIDNEAGFDDNTANVGLTINTELTRIDGVEAKKRWLKEGGIYGVGILYQDAWGKCSFVENASIVNVPFEMNEIIETEEIPGRGGRPPITVERHIPQRRRITWTLTGTPPAYAVKYQMMLSYDRYYGNHFQCRVQPHLYKREMIEGEVESTQTDQMYFWQGKAFQKAEFIVNDRVILYKYVYLLMPLNTPFTPDVNCFVRFTSPGWPEGARRVVPVIGVRGDFLIVDMRLVVDSVVDPRLEIGNFFDWSKFDMTSIEVFLLNDSIDPRFFEVGEMMDVVDGQFSVLSGVIQGDTYNFEESEVLHKYNEPIIAGEPEYNPGLTPDPEALTIFESPSGIMSTTVTTLPKPVFTYGRGVPKVAIQSQGEGNSFTSDAFTVITGGNLDDGSTTPALTSGNLTPVKTLDVAKSSSDWGRAFIEKAGIKRKNLFNSVSFGEQYVQNTEINGLTEFRAANNRQIAVERSPARVLMKAGNVLLCIHERKTTSLYIGRGVIKAEDQFLTVKVDSVIGDDQELGGGFGTIHPESVIPIENDVYGWDGTRGAAWRYTKAGQYPISNNLMEHYFRALGQAYYPYRNIVKIITGYDDINKEFLITFPEVKISNVVILPALTWGFSLKDEVWHTRYSFIPDFYQGTSTAFYSFKNGQLWVHGLNPIYNNFYGVQYTRKWRFASNFRPGVNKRYLVVHHGGLLCADMQSDVFRPVRIYTEQGQESFIPAYEFAFEEGKWVASILRDINTPVEAGKLALRSGEEIMSTYAIFEFECDRLDEAPVTDVNIGFTEEKYSY